MRTIASSPQQWPKVIAHLEKFDPQFVILQCGADSLEGDPITHLRLTAEAHGRAARELTTLAERCGHGRVLALGGGGYNRQNLAGPGTPWWKTAVAAGAPARRPGLRGGGLCREPTAGATPDNKGGLRLVSVQFAARFPHPRRCRRTCSGRP